MLFIKSLNFLLEITQALIEEVRLRPILYDFVNSADIRSKVNKQKAWNEIYTALGGIVDITTLILKKN